MDEYARHIWERRPDFKNSDPGDVSDQVDRTRQNNRMRVNLVDEKGTHFLPASAGKAGKHVTRGQLVVVGVTLYELKHVKAYVSV